MPSRLLVLSFLVILVAGCASPLLDYQWESPAAAIIPIDGPSFVDGRSRFREIFCQLFEREEGIAGENAGCNRLLVQLGDEPRPASPNRPLPAHDHGLRFMIVPGALGECFGADALPYPRAVLLGYANADHWAVAIPMEEGKLTDDAGSRTIGDMIFLEDRRLLARANSSISGGFATAQSETFRNL